MMPRCLAYQLRAITPQMVRALVGLKSPYETLMFLNTFLGIQWTDELPLSKDDKNRFFIDNGRIFAYQGHFLVGDGYSEDEVTSVVNALKLLRHMRPVDPSEDEFVHRTRIENKDSILANGLRACSRLFVHGTRIGQEHLGRPRELLQVVVSIRRLRELGIEVFDAGNGVILVERHVPPECLRIGM